jgi:hypothetical protein
LKVLYLKSSGEVVKEIQDPASRTTMTSGDAASNPEARRASSLFASSV